MNILITGSSGQLSSYLFEEADYRNYDAWGVDIAPPRHKSAEGRTKLIDVRNQEELCKEMSGADAVIHTAAQVSVQKSLEDPMTDGDVNVIGTISALKSAVDAGVKKFVFISSAAVYGNPEIIPVTELHPVGPLSAYGAAKLASEGYVRMFENTYGISTVIIRPFNFYSTRAESNNPYSGVISKFAEFIKNNEKIKVYGDGSQIRDFVHASDVSKMIYAALESDVSGVTFNCGSGTPVSINELAEKVSNAASKQMEIEHLSARSGDIKYSVADVRLAEELLDFRTSVALEEGLKEFFIN